MFSYFLFFALYAVIVEIRLRNLERKSKEFTALTKEISEEKIRRIDDSFKLNECYQSTMSLWQKYIVLGERYTKLRRDNYSMRKDLLTSGIFIRDKT